jgi:hypothetical protein
LFVSFAVDFFAIFIKSKKDIRQVAFYRGIVLSLFVIEELKLELILHFYFFFFEFFTVLNQAIFYFADHIPRDPSTDTVDLRVKCS